jgi:hypothetical protein
MVQVLLRVNANQSITYLQGKTAGKSPSPHPLPSLFAEQLGNVSRFDAGHYSPNSQGNKGYTDPRTGGPTCKTNKIIFDMIYASHPDDYKLTFVQMFCHLDDLCPFKAPEYVNGKKIDFKKHVLNLLTNEESVEWLRVTRDHLKWKYIDAINSRVVDSQESQLRSRQMVILGTRRKVTNRENTDHILDSTHKLAILITLNKALLCIANFFTSIYSIELKFELDTALTVKCISAVGCALGFTKVSIVLENA